MFFIIFELDMKKISILLLTLAALVVSAVSVVPARAASPLKTPPPEQVWAFFEALPDANLPKGIATRAEREEFHKDYQAQLAAIEEMRDAEDEEDVYFGDYLMEVDFQVFWNPTILDPGWMQEVADDLTDVNGPEPSLTLSVFPGSDPDRIFGMLEVREYQAGKGTTILGEYSYWYSVSQKKVTPVTLPLDVPYTDADITDDGLLLYNQNELYWVMRDRKFSWLMEPDRIILTLEGIGAVPVCYNWNGTKFVRDKGYNPMLVYSNGLGQIQMGSRIPFGIHGYESEWIDTGQEYTRAWKFTKEGENDPRIIIYSYGNSELTVDAIDILTPLYRLFEKIYVGMPADKAMEAFKDYYSWDEEAKDPYVSDFDGKAWIFSGQDDPFMLGVDLKYFKNGKLTPDAKVSVVRIAPAVG